MSDADASLQANETCVHFLVSPLSPTASLLSTHDSTPCQHMFQPMFAAIYAFICGTGKPQTCSSRVTACPVVSNLHTIGAEACIAPEASCAACVGVLFPYNK